MDDSSLPDSINPNNFPAKLWRLVNNPAYRAISWDSLGDAIVIDQPLFERQVLCPSNSPSDSMDAFKTTNFSSFVRQLNLYGFRKPDSAVRDSHHSAGDSGTCHHFYNPNFKRNHPELVASLKRLTVDNKAKLQAGLDVTCRPPSRYQRFIGGDDGRFKGSSKLFSPTHQESTHPYYSSKAQAVMAHSGTPVPPRYLMRGHGAALSPTVFASDKGMPVPLSHHYAGVASSSSAVHSLLARENHGSPNFTSFNSPNAQFQPGLYSPVCQCYHTNLMGSSMAGSGLQTGSFSPLSYFQANYPVNMFCCGDNNQHPHNKENQELKKCDINLDTIFQIADEVMETVPSSCLVRVVSPEKPGSALLLPPASCNSVLCESAGGTTDAHPVYAGPIIMAVSGSVDLASGEQKEEPVVSVPEHMPEDAISEVTSDGAKDSEVIAVEVGDSLSDSSQPFTGSAPHV